MEPNEYESLVAVLNAVAASPFQTVKRISFDESDDTDLSTRKSKLTLASDPDCLAIALRIIDLALDRDPWGEIRDALPSPSLRGS